MFLWFGVGGRSCSSFLVSTVRWYPYKLASCDCKMNSIFRRRLPIITLVEIYFRPGVQLQGFKFEALRFKFEALTVTSIKIFQTPFSIPEFVILPGAEIGLVADLGARSSDRPFLRWAARSVNCSGRMQRAQNWAAVAQARDVLSRRQVPSLGEKYVK